MPGEMTVGQLVLLTSLDDEDSTAFHAFRKEAFEVAQEIYDDRAQSYNVSHEPYREMPFGVLSLISELQKRVIRLTSLVTPIREEPLREEDIARIIDSFLDTINYSSWGYGMMKVAEGAKKK